MLAKLTAIGARLSAPFKRIVSSRRFYAVAALPVIAFGLNGPKPELPKSAASNAPYKGVARLDAVGPDDYALRYFASINDTQRVKAELSRLQRLYPAYRAPTDLYAHGDGSSDETELWALYSADKFVELHKAIAQREKDVPGWTISDDLRRKLARKELRADLVDPVREGRWRDVARILEGVKVEEQDVDVQWTIAEAYARTRREPEATAAFKAALTSKERKDQLTTLQKAIGLLRMSDIEMLLAASAPDPDGAPLYKPIMIDVTRRRISAFLHDERAEEISGPEMAAFESFARDSREADQIGLVAWYDYKRRDFRNALEWFKAAIQSGGDARIAHGLAHTLRALGKFREAEEVAFAWREPSVANGILFVDLLERDLTRTIPPYIEADRLARYAKVSMETASGEGAQALAWYSYNSCQYETALFWFERAVAWLPKEATIFGYALTLRRLKRDRDFFELANRYDGFNSKLIELLFPDNYYHPPTPCSGKNAAKLHAPGVKTAFYPAPGPALIPGAAPNYDRSAWSSPLTDQKNASRPIDNAAPNDRMLARALRNLKGRFPVAVLPENPLRFRPLEKYAAQARPLPQDPVLGAESGARFRAARRAPRAGRRRHALRALRLQPAARLERRRDGDLAAGLVANPAARHAMGRTRSRSDAGRRPRGRRPIRTRPCAGPLPFRSRRRPHSGAGELWPTHQREPIDASLCSLRLLRRPRPRRLLPRPGPRRLLRRPRQERGRRDHRKPPRKAAWRRRAKKARALASGGRGRARRGDGALLRRWLAPVHLARRP